MVRRERRGMASASLKWRLTFPTVREGEPGSDSGMSSGTLGLFETCMYTLHWGLTVHVPGSGAPPRDPPIFPL